MYFITVMKYKIISSYPGVVYIMDPDQDELKARCFNHLFSQNLQLPFISPNSKVWNSKFHLQVQVSSHSQLEPKLQDLQGFVDKLFKPKKHMFYHFEQAELKLSQKKSETTTPTPLKPTATTTTRPPQQPILSVAPSFLKLKSTTAIIRKKAERMTQILGLRMFL